MNACSRASATRLLMRSVIWRGNMVTGKRIRLNRASAGKATSAVRL